MLAGKRRQQGVPETPSRKRILIMRRCITCPSCGLTSYNVNDVEQGFCGKCGLYHRAPRMVEVAMRLNLEEMTRAFYDAGERIRQWHVAVVAHMRQNGWIGAPIECWPSDWTGTDGRSPWDHFKAWRERP
jgi:ribosomal protein L37E